MSEMEMKTSYDGVGQLVRPSLSEERNRTHEFHEFMQAHHAIQNVQTHSQLREDLIEHLWQRHGDMYQLFITYGCISLMYVTISPLCM